MKHFLIPALSLVFTACATGPTAYGPAKSPGKIGFYTQQYQKNRFQISYTAKNPDEARAFALLRAAEITKGEGYSHFRIINEGGRQKAGSGVPIIGGAGVGIGKSVHLGGGVYTHIGTGVSVNKVLGALDGEKYTASMEIVLLASSSGTSANEYESASIIKSIKPARYK